MRDLDQEEQKRKDQKESFEEFILAEVSEFVSEMSEKTGKSISEITTAIKKVV